MSEQGKNALTDPERLTMLALDRALSIAKAQVTDLRSELEQAEKNVYGAEREFQGALKLLARARGMESARLSPDATQLLEA